VQSGRETSAVNHGETCRWLYRVETHYGVSGDGSGLGPGTMGEEWAAHGPWREAGWCECVVLRRPDDLDDLRSTVTAG
jgi:hypothetical protein